MAHVDIVCVMSPLMAMVVANMPLLMVVTPLMVAVVMPAHGRASALHKISLIVSDQFLGIGHAAATHFRGNRGFSSRWQSLARLECPVDPAGLQDHGFGAAQRGLFGVAHRTADYFGRRAIGRSARFGDFAAIGGDASLRSGSGFEYLGVCGRFGFGFFCFCLFVTVYFRSVTGLGREATSGFNSLLGPSL